MATTHTDYGKFIHAYRGLDRNDALADTALLLTEGDSWLSTPLYHNLGDWLEVTAQRALFMRMENSGDLATRIFQGGNLRSIGSRLKAFQFDVLLISAGGNDLVDEFLRERFRSQPQMSVAAAVDWVVQSGRFEQVRQAYLRGIESVQRANPHTQILAHSYAYPLLMGQPAKLRVEQIGLAALFKRSIGDWIAKHIRHVLPELEMQQAFAKDLMDQFFELVLQPLAAQHPRFHVVDVRTALPSAQDWNDEMHPSQAGFRKLAVPVREALRALLPTTKQSAI